MRIATKLAVTAGFLAMAAPAAATPVCTDGYMGGPPLAACGGRIFPEAALSRAYIQYTADPRGFKEYQHGLEYLAMKYPRWVTLTTLDKLYGEDAKSVGPDLKRTYDPADTGDGREIQVLKVTDNLVPDEGKKSLMFSLSVHGTEGGGREGGPRVAEDLAMAAVNGGKIADGYDNYTSTTGKTAKLNSYEVRDVLAQEVVYFVSMNPDGWAMGDLWNKPAPGLFNRGNQLGTDLNRQMPTIGSINPSRNPGQETETLYGRKLMSDVAAKSPGGLMSHGADIHGELTSQAYVDIMYPAGQFTSVDHRRLMSIAERTKSAIDKTLFAGIQDLIEEQTGGNDAEGPGKDTTTGTGLASVPTMPAHWATVWDTLGYTDTGFIGDYMATDVAATGMDYEFFLNHIVPEKTWNVYLQENFINGTRALVKTAMAYALYQDEEFNEDNVVVDTGGGVPGYVVNPDTVSSTDENGVGTRPGPKRDGIGADGQPVAQRPYEVTNQQFFRDTNQVLSKPFAPLASADVANDPATLRAVDSLVLADVALPQDTEGRPVDAAAYYANIKDWVGRGGNLILTDRALKTLETMKIMPAGSVKDIKTYQPYANITDFSNPMVEGLRPNARQLVEAAILGYGIGNNASPMTVVAKTAWEAAGGRTVGTTGNNAGTSDDGSQVSIGELELGRGTIRILGAALPMPTEANDHRFGLRNYGLTYTGLFIMENSLHHDARGLGEGALPAPVAAARSRDLACTRTTDTAGERRVASASRLSGPCLRAARG